MSGRAKGSHGLLVAAAASLVLVAGALLYPLVFPDPAVQIAAPLPPPDAAPPPPSPPAPPPRAPSQAAFAIRDAQGAVEVRRGGTWVAVRPGDHLLASEAIRTGADGHAVLRTDSGDELDLRQRVELEVATLSETVTALTLTRGRVAAAPAPGTDRFEIAAGAARTVARGGSRFTVYSDSRGAVAVASEAGEVKVIAHDRTVSLAPRTQTYVPPGGVPGDPVPIPDRVFLAVTWPQGEVTQERTEIHGRTRPGTAVAVNGEPVVVGSDGSFSAEIPVRDGPNRVHVSAETVDGRQRDERGTILVNTHGPPLSADPSHLYDRPDAGPR
jgi:hypothetical protein